MQAVRERVRRQLGREAALPAEAIHEHTTAMPAAYLLNTSLEDMFTHIALIARVRDTFRPMFSSRTPYGSNYTELTIVAYDDPKPGLLAKIAAVLLAHDVSVHAAQVFTRTSSDRIAIDTLWVDHHHKPLSPAKRGEVEEALRQVLTGTLTPEALLARRGKPTDIVQPVRALFLDDRTSAAFGILDVQVHNEPGVFYRLAAALSRAGWNIHAARSSVWGGNARNAYYVTDRNGEKITRTLLPQLDDLLPRADPGAVADGSGGGHEPRGRGGHHHRRSYGRR